MASLRKMNGLRLYGRYIRLHFLSGLQYKGWPLLFLHTIVVVVTDPISTLFLFRRFGSIGPWSMERILLMYAMAVAAFGLAELLFRGFDCFPWRMVQGGEFDRVLLRPRSTFLQVAASAFQINRLSRAVSGVAVSLWCMARLGLPFTPGRMLLLLLALAGGCILYAGVFVLTSGVAFFSVKGLDWIYILTNAGYQITRIPPEYQPRPLRLLFTFLVPILLVSYYPASVIGGWGEPLWKGLLSLPVGLLFLGISLGMWRFGVSRYRSTGS